MGILSRFRDIMASNVNALLDKAEDPEKMIDDYVRSMNSDLGKVRAEAAAVLADERRAKRVLDECSAEISKLQVYAEKAVEAGNEDDARKFLERKVTQVEKKNQLQASYDAASANATRMKQMQDKLVLDMDQLETRRGILKEKLASTKVQQKLNALGSPMGGHDSVFDELEEKANNAYNEAMAIAELRAGKKDDLDELFAQHEKRAGNPASTTNTEDELAAIKDKLENKE